MLNFHTLPVSHSLVCSDLISRGIDLPHVRHVVSYDSPVDITKYVHRVGRTARANRVGDAWSLVEEQEVSSQSFSLLPPSCLSSASLFFSLVLFFSPSQARHFKKMHSKAGRRSHVKKEKLASDETLEVFKEAYEVSTG